MQTEAARPLAPASLEDTTLVQLARNGDLGAFSELCHRHSWTAWETAYAITGDAGDAGDAVSEAFARLFKPGRVVRYEDAQAVQTAILATTRAAAIETVRRSGNDGVDGAYDIGGSGARQTRARGGLPIVSAAYRSLPERWRSVLWLTEVQGVEPAMAAAVLGVSTNGLAQLSTRSRTGLRERYLQAHMQGRVADECRPVVEHLAAYVTGEMTPHNAARIDSHLDSCVECKQRIADLDHLGAMLRSTAVPIPSTLVAQAISKWKLEASAASSVTRQPMRLIPFPTTARKPLAGAALGVLGVGIIGAAIVGGPLLDHGLGGGGIAPAAATPSEVNRPFQIGNAISPVFDNNLLTVGAGPLAALSGIAAPGAAAAAVVANPPAAAAATTTPNAVNGVLPPLPTAPPAAPTAPVTVPSPPPLPPVPSNPLTPILPQPIGTAPNPVTTILPQPIGTAPNPISSLPAPIGSGPAPTLPPSLPKITTPPLPVPTTLLPPNLLPRITTPTLP
jgi:DNA-directed RNA polymerase specialized sigma24 family protein